MTVHLRISAMLAIALIGCAANQAANSTQQQSSGQRERVMLTVVADSAVKTVLIDPRGKRDPWPSQANASPIPSCTRYSEFRSIDDPPYVGPAKYHMYYILDPAPPGRFSLEVTGGSVPVRVNVIAEMMHAATSCHTFDTLTVTPARSATWMLTWNRQSDANCWVRMTRQARTR